MGISKNSDHIQIKIKCQPQSGTSSVLQSPNQDLKDIHVLGTFKIKIENIGVSKISDHIQTNTDMPNSSWEPPASSKGQVKTQRTLMFFAPSLSRWRARIWNMGIPKTSAVNIWNKPSPAKVGSNKLRVHIGFDLSRIRQTQL